MITTASKDIKVKDSEDPNSQGASKRRSRAIQISKDTITETSENRKKGHSKQTHQADDMQNIKCHQNSMQNRRKSSIKSTYEETRTGCSKDKKTAKYLDVW